MTPDTFRHLERLRVRWAEIDAQHIVFNGHYLMYFDTAMAGYWRSAAVPYMAAMQRLGGDLYVRKATLEYAGSARYEDVIDIGLRCARIGNSSLRFEGVVFRGGQPLVTGELVYVYADPATQTSRPVPDALRALLDGFEAGEPMLQVRCGDWATLGTAARALRDEVFVHEQGIDIALEHDDHDAGALHAVAFNRLDQAVATGRLLPAQAGADGPVSRLGRMAVPRVLRGAGVGRQVLDALCAAARSRGDARVQLHAQRTAVDFYRRAGFVPVGEPFTEAGLPHQTMERAP